MTALTLLNNLDREFSRPFFAPAFANQLGLNSEMAFNDDSRCWELTLEAAGVTKDNLKIDLQEGLLKVAGEKTKGLETGKFEKVFRIPEHVDPDKIEAQFEDGVLKVTLPIAEKMNAKKIEIK